MEAVISKQYALNFDVVTLNHIHQTFLAFRRTPKMTVFAAKILQLTSHYPKTGVILHTICLLILLIFKPILTFHDRDPYHIETSPLVSMW